MVYYCAVAKLCFFFLLILTLTFPIKILFFKIKKRKEKIWGKWARRRSCQARECAGESYNHRQLSLIANQIFVVWVPPTNFASLSRARNSVNYKTKTLKKTRKWSPQLHPLSRFECNILFNH